ncbi:MAG: DUF4251 domain-containing protein [Bacteroidota bacterium]
MQMKVFFLGLFSFVLFSCGGSLKGVEAAKAHARLDALVQQRSFEIVADWAMPQMTNSMTSVANSGLLPPGSAGNRINLIGNPNYLRIQSDSVSAYLPYYGERQMGAGYNSTDRNAITFNGVPKDFEIVKKKRDPGYDVTFGINNETEFYTVQLSLFPNLTGQIIVNSSQRFVIRYSGDIKEINTDSKDVGFGY